MSALFASGRIVDLILLLVLAEAVALLALHRATGRGPPPAALLPNLAAGACLLLALRSALRGAPWPLLALCLLGSLLAHLADLRERWRAPEGQAGQGALPWTGSQRSRDGDIR